MFSYCFVCLHHHVEISAQCDVKTNRFGTLALSKELFLIAALSKEFLLTAALSKESLLKHVCLFSCLFVCLVSLVVFVVCCLFVCVLFSSC